MIASLMFAGAKVSCLLLPLGFSIPVSLEWIGFGCAVVLFLSSVACVTWNGKMAFWSLCVSLLSTILLSWPTLAR